MSYYNRSNFTSTYGQTGVYDDTTQSSSSSNLIQDSNQVNISQSSLEATAQEFYPSNSTSNVPSVNGAIKKNTQNERNKYRENRNKRGNKYGSGRIFNKPKYNYNTPEQGTNNEQNRSVQQMVNLKYSNFERNDEHAHYLYNNTNSAIGYDDTEPYDSKLNRDRDYQQDKYKQYGYKNKYDNNFNNKPKPSESQSYENPCNNYNGKNDKFNKPFFENKYKRNNSYQRERNYGYDKNSQSNSYTERSENNKYCDRMNNSSDSNELGDRNKSKRFESKNFQFKEKEKVYNNFAANFTAYESSKNGKNRGDWRKGNVPKDRRTKGAVQSSNKIDAASQRERLEEMLNRRLLECLVCCEKIRHPDKVWNCMQCYHILHLYCVAAWAKSSKVENGWRCPACQNVCTEVPKQYKCYCGKALDPKYDPGVRPHGCGDVCLRKGRMCEHKCTILCHPGPCPDCSVMVEKPCGCGSTKQIVKCSTDIEIICTSVCNKILNCGIHQCKSVCHSGNCTPCREAIIQECYCNKQGRKVICSAEISGSLRYSCEDICEKILSCGNHKCQEKCHDGPCDPCARDVSVVHSCPCGKTPLQKARASCRDPIPCCDKICGKSLTCGQPSLPHTCRELCHNGNCPPCPLTTVVRCRCGHMDKEVSCSKVTTKADDARCEKKCTKKRTCGKHRCNQRCCIEIEHFCPLPCNHQLSCGQHRCERTCHSGRCPPCIETSFEELHCECGTNVLYPPIPCGTKPPSCDEPCSRPRECGHDVNHTCHTGPCPHCTVLCKKWCHGHHEQRSAIPCHQETFSCGLPCGKQMPCGRHKCNKPCHDGPCQTPCRQPCNIPRDLCGHPCGKPCHDPPCPESSCKQNVPVTCVCGVQKGSRACIDVAEEFKHIEMAQLKEKMGDFSKDQTVDISDIVSKPKKPTILKILECTEECRVLERNRRLAIGLQIRNPDLSQKLTPKYTDFLRQWAKKDPHFCQKIHDKLTELVQLAKQSKQKSRSHSFESMNRDKRHFIHEYCEHFGVESAAYDMEPNRNVVATAVRDKSWMPSMSLLEVIQRENGQRRVPGPAVLSKSISSKSETVTLKLPGQSQRQV